MVQLVKNETHGVNAEGAKAAFSPANTRLGEGLMQRIGNTPLLRLERIGADLPGIQVLGKVLLDSTSGNTGIAYAMLGAAESFPVTLCMPSNVSQERKHILRAYGAHIVYTDPAEGSDGSIRKAREMYAAEPQHYFYADQYSNDANWRAHYHGTAAEIWRQTEGRITHFVAMLGTSGTFMGAARRLKEFNPGIRCISLQPDSSFHGIEGAKHMATAIVPKIYDPGLADDDLGISTEASYAMVRRLAREEGLLVGISAGAAIVGCFQIARGLAER